MKIPLYLTSFVTGLLITGSAYGSTVTPLPSLEGNKVLIDEIDAYTTTGATMGGMQITVNYGSASHETVAWNNGAFGVTNSWSLSMVDANNPIVDALGVGNGNALNTIGDAASGYSWWALWVDPNSSFEISSISINGNINNSQGVAFDTARYPLATFAPGVTKKIPNTSQGRSFQSMLFTTNDTDTDLNYQYSDALYLQGKNPYGDLYETLTINFLGDNGFGAGDVLYFAADTDRAQQSPVPEPATMILFGTGLFGLLCSRRSKRAINSTKSLS